jgi:N-dimethylarginine dimethylaminohydrolase
MSSINEWDKLNKVIVGIADGAKIPEIDDSMRCVNYAGTKALDEVIVGPYPEQVIREANRDLDNLAHHLTNSGIEVLRPEKTDTSYYNYCPRDVVFTYGDRALATPMPITARKDDYMALKTHFKGLTVAPNYSGRSYLYNKRCVLNKDVLALTETFPMFDAANILKANDHVLYLVSNSGNKKGAQYLQEWLGSDVKVHTLEGVYSYMHIDSTIAFLREGLMLLNPERIPDKSVLPKPFCDWDAIMCPEPVDIGHYSGYQNASEWIGMNLLSVDENTVVIEEHQIPTIKALEKRGFDVYALPMEHSRTLGGSFHCVTLDIDRG